MRSRMVGMVIAVVLLAGGLWLLRSRRGAARSGDTPAATEPASATTTMAATTGDAPAAKPAAKVRDKLTPAERKALLDSIERARVKRLANRAISPPSSPPSAPEEAHGTLDKEYIRERVREIVPLLKECYENSLRDHPGLGGRLLVEFAIVAEESVGGLVESSEVLEESTLREPAMVECVRESMYALRMKAPEGGGRVTVTYPFVFAADGPPDGG